MLLLLLLPKFDGSISWRFRFEDRPGVCLLDLSSLLYDINLLYDAIVLSLFPKYEDYKFSEYFWYRRGRPIEQNHRLMLKRIRSDSPIELVTVITAAAASVGVLWALLQAIEKIQNWNLNHQKLELEVDNLIRERQKRNAELEKIYLERETAMMEIERVFAEKESHEIINRILRRIEKLNIIATEVDFSISEEDTNNEENDHT